MGPRPANRDARGTGWWRNVQEQDRMSGARRCWTHRRAPGGERPQIPTAPEREATPVGHSMTDDPDAVIADLAARITLARVGSRCARTDPATCVLVDRILDGMPLDALTDMEG